MHNMTVHHQPLFFHQEPYSLLSKKLSEQRQQYSFNNFTELEMTRFLYNDDGRIFTVLFNFTDIIYTDNISNNTLRQNISLNTILAEFNSSLYVYNRVPNIILISVYATLFLLALFSNILIIVSVYWFQRLRSVTNYLLVNLSCADLMVTLICMPTAIGTNIYRLWIYGDVMCKIVTYMEGVAVSASVFTLTAMSIDRYIAIRHPMTFRKVFNKSLARNVIVVVWLVSFSIFIPVLFVRKTVGFHVNQGDDAFIYCVEKWSNESNKQIYSAMLFVIVYAIPGHVVILAYSMMGCTLRTVSGSLLLSSGERHAAETIMKGRRKIARVMLLLALIFAVCWLPYNILTLVLENKDDNALQQRILKILPFTLLLGHANSAINPLLYCLLAKTFRLCVCNAVCRCLFHPSPSSTMRRHLHQKGNKLESVVRIKGHDTSSYSTTCTSCSGCSGGCYSSNTSEERLSSLEPAAAFLCYRIQSCNHHSPKLAVVTTNTEMCAFPKYSKSNV